MKEMKVSFVNLGAQYSDLQDQIIAKINEISFEGSYILSDEVKKFEEGFATYCDAKYAIGVGNATDALFLVLKALGIGPGDEVITAPNSFIASAGAIVAAGATPILSDIGEDYNLDPALIEKAITPHTKALMPVHLTGMPADMDEILRIAKKHSLVVIEDCAQAIGARYKGRRVGALGVAGCFSLHPLKNLHVQGDGGMITTQDPSLYETLCKLRNHGLKNRDVCEFFGYNSRLDSIQAAIGNIKLKRMDEYTRRFQGIARFYHNELKNTVKVPVLPPEREGVFHNFVIQVDRREELQNYLLSRGVETKIHYPIPIHMQPAATKLGYKIGSFPVSERQAKEIMSLPVYPELTDVQIGHVTQCILDFYQT